MRKPDSKLLKAMMLGTLAFAMMLGSMRASAAETVIVKCTNPKGGVAFQDFACADNQLMEVFKVEINQSADVAPGLRPYEQVVLARSFERQQLERILNSPNLNSKNIKFVVHYEHV